MWLQVGYHASAAPAPHAELQTIKAQLNGVTSENAELKAQLAALAARLGQLERASEQHAASHR